jgi:hypothetical protein
MTITGRVLYMIVAILVAWLLFLCWAIWKARATVSTAHGRRHNMTLAGLVSSSIAVGALLALHLSWTSVAVSQKLGEAGISIIAKFLFWPTLIGLVTSLCGIGKIRFVGVASCIVTGLWWFSLFMEAAISMSGPTVRHPIRYLIPDNYVGWVAVEYGVSETPELPLKSGAIQIKFPENGVVKTQSKLEDGWAHDSYYSYATSGQVKPMKDTGWGGGGMIWAATVGGDSDGHSGMNHITEQFFVGTEDQYKHSPGVSDNHGKAEVGNEQH